MDVPKPFVGAVVHYSEHGKCRAATITEVTGRAVNIPDLTQSDMWVASLFVVYPHSLRFTVKIVQMEGASHDINTWHWPEERCQK